MKKLKYALCMLIMLITMLTTTINSYAYPLLLEDNPPYIHISQAEQFLKDRNSSQELLENLDYIYKYSNEVGIDPSIIVGMISLETGYGKSNLFMNYNNPGGIKSKSGWAHYEDKKAGIRAMVNLLATYAGIRNPNSWLYGKSTTSEGLAGLYWTNYGNDYGYHNKLKIIIETMKKYPIIEEKLSVVIKKEESNKDAIGIIDNIKNKKRTSSDIIYDILHKSNKENPNVNKILDIIK